ncbi:hypothetical protein NX801_09420 [Streptomyces sp. LP05-1]|uniref:Uncharacterized protein n=1 Tax=Streptomyces pyxinae TaxID=2970734 RepID=A0ABT2CGP3_9ACTN|nr:hypothetical protein [Streptomyces sp. LP05-1]MCS0635881.1 hypothetical protein [Streptomyces sp. LP05-1]
MRLAWLAWLWRHGDEYGFGGGWLSGVVGSLVVVATALVVAYSLRRNRPLSLAAGAAVGGAGFAWLATH